MISCFVSPISRDKMAVTCSNSTIMNYDYHYHSDSTHLYEFTLESLTWNAGQHPISAFSWIVWNPGQGLCIDLWLRGKEEGRDFSASKGLQKPWSLCNSTWWWQLMTKSPSIRHYFRFKSNQLQLTSLFYSWIFSHTGRFICKHHQPQHVDT